MGSDSDLKVMSKAAVMLEELGIEYEMTIISAHREPDELIEWTRGAESRGIKVMIAGAGMAAALPGMCAALFALPVIGVPLSGKNLEGMERRPCVRKFLEDSEDSREHFLLRRSKKWKNRCCYQEQTDVEQRSNLP